jgi:uncharacterized membrane protein
MSREPPEPKPGQSQPDESTSSGTDPVPVEKQIGDVLAPLSKVVKEEQLTQVKTQILAVVQEAFTGPMPHPRHLAEYEETLPGCAERIMRMAEKEQDARHSVSAELVEIEKRNTKRGMWFGFIIAGLLVAGAVTCAAIGQTTVAVALVAAAAVGMVSKLINGWRGGAGHGEEPPKPDKKPGPSRTPPKKKRR